MNTPAPSQGSSFRRPGRRRPSCWLEFEQVLQVPACLGSYQLLRANIVVCPKFGVTWALESQPFSSQQKLYHPITKLSHHLDWGAGIHSMPHFIAHLLLMSVHERFHSDAKPDTPSPAWWQCHPCPHQRVCQLRCAELQCAIFTSKLNKVLLKSTPLGLYWVPRILVSWATQGPRRLALIV